METRRQFVGGILGCLMAIGCLWNPLFSIVRSTLAKAKKIVLPTGTKRETLIERNPAHLDTRNLQITPLDDFGTMGLDDYQEDLNSWRLEVTGHVENPLTLSYGELIALPPVERDVLLICPGFFANHGRWKGVSVRDVLNLAKWKKEATHVTFRGPKSSYESLHRFPIADILSDRVFLAFRVNGKTLPEKHGFPLRVVAQGYYGHDWIKYVYKLTVERIPPASG